MDTITRSLARRLAMPAVVLSALAATAVAGPSLAASSAADAVTTNCVTKAEYKKVTKGMTRAKAQRVMGATPQQSFKHPQHPGATFHDYRACGETGLVQLVQKNRKIAGKAASWGYRWEPAPPPPGMPGGTPPPPPGTGGGELPPPPPPPPGTGGGDQLPW
jgi:hypothetical protein